MSGTDSYVQVIAPKYGLDPALVAAIITVESNGDRFAHRYESAYEYLWNVRTNSAYRVRSADRTRDNAPDDFPAPVYGGSADTEWVDQQASWGLMQVMGAVAREQGMTGFLTNLTDPMLGVNHGCKLLSRLRDRYLTSDGWAGVLASYNGGGPYKTVNGTLRDQAYVDRVKAASGQAISSLFNH